MSGPDRPGAAFVDVDDTLITQVSLFGFLRAHYRRSGRPDVDYDLAMAHLRRLRSTSLPREQVNRAYYRLLKGESWSAVTESARAWFDEASATGTLFNPAMLDRVQQHRGRGHDVVLVSGSFSACLEPIASATGATTVLASDPQIEDGVLTGEIGTAMVGRAKAVAASSYVRRHGLSVDECWAYGDHVSDLHLLQLVGNPVVVGDDPDLGYLAGLEGWARLDGAPVSSPSQTAGVG